MKKTEQELRVERDAARYETLAAMKEWDADPMNTYLQHYVYVAGDLWAEALDAWGEAVGA